MFSLLIAAAHQKGYHNLDTSPRKASNLGIFSQFDGNYIGGILLGTGLALTGACPGTVFAQVAVGLQTGRYALLGGCTAGIFWTGILKPYLNKACSATVEPKVTEKSLAEQKSASSKTASDSTWHGTLKITPERMLLIAECAYAIVVSGTGFLAEGNSGYTVVSALIGGTAIGTTQLLSLASRGKLIGVSGCYRELGDWFWWIASGGSKGARPSIDAISFTLALMAGARALHTFAPGAVLASSVSPSGGFQVPPLTSFVGGASMALGALMAGGCTSGHGISGMSSFSTASLITIGTMFGVGALVAKGLY